MKYQQMIEMVDKSGMPKAFFARQIKVEYQKFLRIFDNDFPNREIVEKLSDYLEANPPIPLHRESENLKKKPITTREIIERYLIEHGYDGLFSGDGCACKLSGIEGLFPCCVNFENCKAGWKKDCGTCEKYDDNDAECTEKYNFCIGDRQ